MSHSPALQEAIDKWEVANASITPDLLERMTGTDISAILSFSELRMMHLLEGTRIGDTVFVIEDEKEKIAQIDQETERINRAVSEWSQIK